MATLEVPMDNTQAGQHETAGLLPEQTHVGIRAARLAGLRALQETGIPAVRAHDVNAMQSDIVAGRGTTAVVDRLAQERTRSL